MLDWKTFRQWHKYSGYGHTRNESRKEYNKQLIETYTVCKTINDCPPVAKAPWPSAGSVYSLGTVEVTQPPACKKSIWGCKQEEGNNPMNYATATVQAGTTETQDQRKYLAKRLEEVYYTHEAPLYAKFGLSDDVPPTTPKELSERIKDGKFIIKGKKTEDGEFDDDEEYFYGGWARMIRWRDPSKKSDADGYEAARKELTDLRQKALDIIKIDEPKAGLDAIKAFEAWTPTGAAN